MRITTGLMVSICVAGLIQPLSVLAQSSASSASSSAASSSGSKTELTAEEKGWLKLGYTLKLDKGNKVFCHMETELGSRFSHSACYTSEQLESRTNSAQEAFDPARRTQSGH